jgi:hypothetical protein
VSHADRRRFELLWALVPLVTVGFAAFAPPLYFAVRYHRRAAWVWTGVLAVLDVTSAVLAADDSHATDGALGTIGVCLWFGGPAVALWLYATSARSAPDPVAKARADRRIRARARKLAARDPHLAVEAGIGRPDLAGDHRDGGLVDVNRVPAAVLAALPGISQELAERIVTSRPAVGGYASFDDLVNTLGLNPTTLDDAVEHLVFIRL